MTRKPLSEIQMDDIDAIICALSYAERLRERMEEAGLPQYKKLVVPCIYAEEGYLIYHDGKTKLNYTVKIPEEDLDNGTAQRNEAAKVYKIAELGSDGG